MKLIILFIQLVFRFATYYLEVMVNILITGVAGFIGFHLAKRCCADGYSVTGIDNLNHYYDVSLKQSRLKILEQLSNFQFAKIDITESAGINEIFERGKFDYVVNLAAQAGVRYSLENPFAYIESNITGFLNILEACRAHSIKHLVYASSSSVYGANTKLPFSEHDNVDHQLSLYGATKKSNELMAHTYSALYEIPTTGLRFFTVYGPWGRPDMALFKFTKSMLAYQPIDVYNHGKMQRDFTYVDDIVEGVFRILFKIPENNKDWNSDAPDPATSFAPFRLFNIGGNDPVKLMSFIEEIEKALGIKAQLNLMPLQPGDVPATSADVTDLEKATDFKPQTPISQGIKSFVNWYREFYGV